MDVALVVVPFADIARPAIGISLLKAELRRRGFETAIHYFNLHLAELIGAELYAHISDNSPSDAMIGEWFFADLVFGAELPAEHEFVRNILGAVMAPDAARRILEARRLRDGFIEHCTQALAATGAPIVGFTTTFHQTCACLAIAKRLKALPNPPLVCFGGANCEGEMGLQIIQSFPWVDYVCTREGDEVFPRFVERYLRHAESQPLPGFLKRGASTEVTYPRMVTDLDALPIPDYDDYVRTLRASPLNDGVKPEMQFEAARGCWWGAKHHCTFCGLNGDTMPFRSKSPQRVFEEIRYLHDRYGYKRIDSVDNILDHRYINTVFARLAEANLGLQMFYEVKANLNHAQLLSLQRGGVTAIQPGIESLSSEILRLMKKGVTAAQNIQLIKWSEEVGILPAWNVLAGFPGESPEEYRRMAQLIPLLTHLEPPTGCAKIRLDRFSPLFNNAQTAGLRRVRPTHAYYYVFPLGRRELARLAYFFDFDYEDGRKPEQYIQAVQNEITRWRNARFVEAPMERPRLDAHWDAETETLHVKDTRACAVRAKHSLTGLQARLLLDCDTAHSHVTLERHWNTAMDKVGLDDALEHLIEARLMARIDDLYLSLPVLRNRPALNKETDDALSALSRPVADPQPLPRVFGATG